MCVRLIEAFDGLSVCVNGRIVIHYTVYTHIHIVRRFRYISQPVPHQVTRLIQPHSAVIQSDFLLLSLSYWLHLSTASMPVSSYIKTLAYNCVF